MLFLAETMIRFPAFAAVLLSLLSLTALAQTDEPIHYAVTAPAGLSLTLDGTLTLPAKGPVPVVLLIAGSGATDRDGNSPGQIANLGTLKAAPYRAGKLLLVMPVESYLSEQAAASAVRF